VQYLAHWGLLVITYLHEMNGAWELAQRSSMIKRNGVLGD